MKPETFFLRFESQAISSTEGFDPWFLKLEHFSQGKFCYSALMTLRPSIMLRREKGQPKGFAVKGKAGRLRAVEFGFYIQKTAAGQNNSNLTPLTTTVVNGGWELLQKISSHCCFYTPHISSIMNIFEKRFIINGFFWSFPLYKQPGGK